MFEPGDKVQLKDNKSNHDLLENHYGKSIHFKIGDVLTVEEFFPKDDGTNSSLHEADYIRVIFDGRNIKLWASRFEKVSKKQETLNKWKKIFDEDQ